LTLIKGVSLALAVMGGRKMSWLLRPTMIAVVGLILASGMANADCMRNGKGEIVCGKGECQRDRRGVVLCSAFRKGSAVRTSDGKIVCGKGRCVKTLGGVVFCSTVAEGDAVKDINGVPRCEGQCERASVDYCEATPAGSATD